MSETARIENPTIKSYSEENFEIAKTLVVSTVHITLEDSKKLPGIAGRVIDHGYGWLVHVGGDDSDTETIDSNFADFSPEFLHLFTIAREQGCLWLNLDQDGPEYESLQQFDW